MDKERRRILRMLVEGTISVEECEELLQALTERRSQKVEQDVCAAKGNRPNWPYVLVIFLAPVAILIWFGLIGLFMARTYPRFLGPLAIPLFIFWVWMTVDCLSRLACDFRLLFTSRHDYEKWIWLAIVFLAGWVGAIAYFIIIRMPARAIAAPASIETPERPKEPFVPRPRSRSIIPWIILTVFVAAAISVIATILASFEMGDEAFLVGLMAFGTIIGLALSLFWIWMLVDCLARDYREFGTICSDKSADKLIWILLLLFIPLVGALAYHISVRRRTRPLPAAA